MCQLCISYYYVNVILNFQSALRDAINETEDDEGNGSLTTTISRTDRYAFNEKHSDLVAISADKKTASRQLPMFCFDNGIAFTDQPLRNNEIFEVRIEQMIRMFNGTVEIGEFHDDFLSLILSDFLLIFLILPVSPILSILLIYLILLILQVSPILTILSNPHNSLQSSN